MKPIVFEASHVEHFFGFDADGSQYRFDAWWQAKDWVDEDPDHRAAMKQTVDTTHETYQHVYCALCRQVSPMQLGNRRICMECAKKRNVT